jgi:Family of unknown function (DUF6349)
MTRAPAAGQGDMLAMLQQEATPRCLYHSPARGPDARAEEFQAWQAEFGRAGSAFRAHAWTVNITCPDSPTDRCQPTVLSVDLRVPWDSFTGTMPACDCTRQDALAYRGACRKCPWEGPQVASENLAVEDACGHAHPGWWDLPTVPARPDDTRDKLARWRAAVDAAYPAGWIANGGPFRTLRAANATRHCYLANLGCYDLGVPA